MGTGHLGPVLLIPVLEIMPHNITSIGWQSLCGFANVSVISMLLLEPVSWKEVLAALIVIACVLVGRRAGATPINIAYPTQQGTPQAALS